MLFYHHLIVRTHLVLVYVTQADRSLRFLSVWSLP